jgi:hypothetical protein
VVVGSIYLEHQLDVPAEVAWEVVDRYTRSEVHIFLFTDGERQEGDYRVVSLPDGREVWELGVSVDPDHRRASYTIPGMDGVEHHHASMQVFDDGVAGRSRIVWIADVRPDAACDALRPIYQTSFVDLVAALNSGARR